MLKEIIFLYHFTGSIKSAFTHYKLHKYIQKKLMLHRIYSWTCKCGLVIGHPNAGEVVECDDIEKCPICRHHKK